MISENPVLGPEWEPLAEALGWLILKTKKDDVFVMGTYGKRYGLQPGTSPYFQGNRDQWNSISIEASANHGLSPELTEEDFNLMEFLGWNKPDDSTDSRPNFERTFADDVEVIEIVEFILETMVVVYGITQDDFFNFGPRSDRIEGLGKLGRLAWSEGNPYREIFALPGHHVELLTHEDGL